MSGARCPVVCSARKSVAAARPDTAGQAAYRDAGVGLDGVLIYANPACAHMLVHSDSHVLTGWPLPALANQLPRYSRWPFPFA